MLCNVLVRVSPLDDIEVIQTELCLADMSSVEKRFSAKQKARAGDKMQQKLVSLLEKNPTWPR